VQEEDRLTIGLDDVGFVHALDLRVRVGVAAWTACGVTLSRRCTWRRHTDDTRVREAPSGVLGRGSRCVHGERVDLDVRPRLVLEPREQLIAARGRREPRRQRLGVRTPEGERVDDGGIGTRTEREQRDGRCRHGEFREEGSHGVLTGCGGSKDKASVQRRSSTTRATSMTRNEAPARCVFAPISPRRDDAPDASSVTRA
jgi:hypothetical protein